MLVNYHADGQIFKFRLRPAQEFQFQFLFFNTRTQSDCACRGHGQACLDRRVLLVSQTVVESIQLFFIWSGDPVVSDQTRAKYMGFHSDSHTPYEVFLSKFLWPMCWSFGIWLEWGSGLRTFAPLENLVLSWVRRVVRDDCVEILRVGF